MFARAIISSPHHFLHVKSSDRLIDLPSFFIFFSVDNHPSSPRKVSNSGVPRGMTKLFYFTSVVKRMFNTSSFFPNKRYDFFSYSMNFSSTIFSHVVTRHSFESLFDDHPRFQSFCNEWILVRILRSKLRLSLSKQIF